MTEEMYDEQEKQEEAEREAGYYRKAMNVNLFAFDSLKGALACNPYLEATPMTLNGVIDDFFSLNDSILEPLEIPRSIMGKAMAGCIIPPEDVFAEYKDKLSSLNVEVNMITVKSESDYRTVSNRPRFVGYVFVDTDQREMCSSCRLLIGTLVSNNDLTSMIVIHDNGNKVNLEKIKLTWTENLGYDDQRQWKTHKTSLRHIVNSSIFKLP